MTLTKGHARNAAMTPLDQRLQDMAQHVCNADGSPRTGVLGSASAGAALVSATGTWNVAVAAAEFVGSKGKADGIMIFTNDGTTNVLIGGAPVSNSRIDVIWAKQNDDTTGDANAQTVFGVTAGVAQAVPVKPAIPTGAVEIGTIRVYSGTTATNNGLNTVTQTFQMTASRGGVVALRTKAELDAWTNPAEGTNAHLLDTEMNFRYENGAWVCKSRALASMVTAVAQSIPNGVDTTVIFPVGVSTKTTLVGSGISVNPATGIVTIDIAGTYRIVGQATYAAGGSIASHLLTLARNAGTAVGDAISSLKTSASNDSHNVECVVECVAGDTIRMKALQVSNVTKNLGVAGGQYWTTLIVERIVA